MHSRKAMPPQQRFWRLILRRKKNRNRLAAVQVSAQDTFPMLVTKILELVRSSETTGSSLLFKPVAHVVRLEQPSEFRFDYLQPHTDSTAFNNEDFDAVFSNEVVDKFMTAALRCPWQYGPGFDFIEYYSELLSDALWESEETEAPGPKSVGLETHLPARSHIQALKISYEVSPFALLVLITAAVLAVATIVSLAAVIATGNGKFAVGLGIAVATIVVAYASFASDVYNLVG